MYPPQHGCMLCLIMVSILQFICQAKYNCSTDFSTLPATPQQSLVEQFRTLIARLRAIKLVDSGRRQRNNPKMLVTLILGHFLLIKTGKTRVFTGSRFSIFPENRLKCLIRNIIGHPKFALRPVKPYLLAQIHLVQRFYSISHFFYRLLHVSHRLLAGTSALEPRTSPRILTATL